MCLPGTIETVREQTEREGVSRRALLAGGGAAADRRGACRARPTRKRAPRPRPRHGTAARASARSPTSPTRFRAGFPVYTGDEPTRRTLKNYDARRLLLAGVDLRRALRHAHGRARALRRGRPPGAAAAPRGAARAGGGRSTSRAAPPRTPTPRSTPDDLRRYERRHGRIPRGAVVFMNSGWAAKVNDDAAFKGTARHGTYHFPGFGIDAVEFLLTRRDIQGIGVDTLSLDPGNSTTFAVHNRLLGADSLRDRERRQPVGAAPQRRVRVGRRRAVGGGLRRALPRARLRLSRAISGR